MKVLLEKVVFAMDQLDHIGQEEFVTLVGEALAQFPELGWELGPDLAEPDAVRLSLAVRNAPDFRERATATGALPITGAGWVIGLGVPPRDSDIYLEAQAGDGVLAIEGELLGWQLRGSDDRVDLVVGIPAGPLRQLAQAEMEELAEIFVMGELGELNLMDHVNSISVEQIEAVSPDWPPLTTLRAGFVDKFPSCAYADWLRTSRA